MTRSRARSTPASTIGSAAPSWTGLARSRSFRLAFEPDAMQPARFADHPTVAATLKSFVAARDALDGYTMSPQRV